LPWSRCGAAMEPPDQRTAEELLAEAAKARHDAKRFRQAAEVIHDDIVERSLRARAEELETLAGLLEAQAAKKQSS
jgi:predicted signal transduction protein with EAL and GGDEF domain